MQFHTAKLFLYQVAFFERNLQQHPSLHLNILREGLEGAKAFLDLYLWLPPKSEMSLTNSEWIQLSFGVTLAAKFAIISKEPGIEPQTRELRHRLNIDNVFRHLALRIGALVGRANDGEKQKDIFFYYEQRVRKIQKWYERMLRATGADCQSSDAFTKTQSQSPSSSYQQQNPPLPRNSPSDALSTMSVNVPLSTSLSHQQPQSCTSSLPYTSEPLSDASYQAQLSSRQTHSAAPSYQESSYQAPMATVGMLPMSTYQSYSPVPSIAYLDLINAKGWDNMFTIPMEQDALIFDVSQGYGLGMASPPSDASSWESPPPQ